MLGIAAAYAVARTVDSFLYRTDSHDVVTFGAVPALPLAIAPAACACLPYRASRVPPITALRAE